MNESLTPNWYRGFIQGKTRIALAWIFAALLIFSARNYPTAPGIILCFLGATLRFWASGYLRKDSRPAVGGPYAWVRNPLYLGTYLMALGTAWAIQNYVLLAVITVLFAAIYHFIILDEETKLTRIFGEPYAIYRSAVPRFFPRPWPAKHSMLEKVNPEADHWRFSYEIAVKNKAMEAYYSFAGLIGFVALIAWLWHWSGRA
ncbi:MAG: isoprenylcysteine carboxylmethyltransferase family protein [Oligoflexia bacterium]|nr:isoprenylcysteine carboxylmethyltransferase family protein [Oligoflexia bacterium]